MTAEFGDSDRENLDLAMRSDAEVSERNEHDGVLAEDPIDGTTDLPDDVLKSTEGDDPAREVSEQVGRVALNEKRFTFVGSDGRHPEAEMRYDRWRQSSRSLTWLFGEVEMTPDEKVAVGRLNDAYSLMGDEIGVDLASRRTELRNCHVFPTVNAYRHAVVPRYGGSENSIGLSAPELGIAWARQANPTDNTSNIAHELAHDKSSAEVEVTTLDLEGNGELLFSFGSRVGYTRLSESHPHGLTEFTTDIATHRAMALAGFHDANTNYKVADIIGDALVRRAALVQGAFSHEVADLLVKGMCDGSDAGLDAVRQHLQDARQMDVLTNMPGVMSVRAAISVARILDLPKAVDALREYRRGKPPIVFNWRRPAGPN